MPLADIGQVCRDKGVLLYCDATAANAVQLKVADVSAAAEALARTLLKLGARRRDGGYP